MTIKNTILGGTDAVTNERIFSADFNDTNNAIIGYSSNVNPSLPPIGSVLAWRKDFHVPGQDRWEMVDTTTYETSGTGFVMGSSYTMDGTRDFVDKLEIEIRLTGASASATIVYALFTYKDATTWSSEEVSQGSDWAVKTIVHPNKTKEVDKIEMFHRRSGGNWSMDAQMRNLNIKREFTNYIGELTDECWVECNGQIIADTDSPYHGVTLPDLNGPVAIGLRGQFLRGHSTSGVTETSQNLAHTHSVRVGGVTVTGSGSGGGQNRTTSTVGENEARPYSYSNVWIIRVK